MSTPAVSVCIITFNQAAYIEQAVLSALDQVTTFDYEIVIGDDCSTDGTPALLKSLAQQYSRIRLLDRPRNLGINRNLASTVGECRGRYVALLEGDDYWTDPTKLQRQYEFLESRPDFAMCFHPAIARRDGEADTKIPRGRIPLRTTLADLIERGNFIPTPSVMFRNDTPLTFPDWYFDLRIGDLPLNVMNARTGDIGLIDRSMAVYRIHTDGAFSALSNAQRVSEVVRMYEHLKTLLNPAEVHILTGSQNYWKAVECFRSGKEGEARAHARLRFATPPFNRQKVMAGLMAYVPFIYRLIRRHRPVPE